MRSSFLGSESERCILNLEQLNFFIKLITMKIVCYMFNIHMLELSHIFFIYYDVGHRAIFVLRNSY